MESISRNARIEVVDALRGFAVMAIILVHNLEHFIFPVYPTSAPHWLEVMDKSVADVVFTLFAGKAYAIFALLFGFTFFLQMDKRRREGYDFGFRFLWRLLLLIVFATLNAAFFPAGDVLLLFVVVGLVLFLTRSLSDRGLLLIAVFFLLQPLDWFHYIIHLIAPSYQIPDLKVGEMYTEVGEVVKSGNVYDFFVCNMTLGQKASLLWAWDAGRFFQTAGLFLLGSYFGRKSFFVASPDRLRILVKVLAFSALVYAPLLALKDSAVGAEAVIQKTVGTVLDMWQKLAFTLVLITSFVLLYQSERFHKATDGLRFYGRMSLTNYVSQSIFGALIYFPIGLYLAPYCGNTLSLLIGFATFGLQVVFSKWWLARHKQGPLEYVWHRWTWICSNRK